MTDQQTATLLAMEREGAPPVFAVEYLQEQIPPVNLADVLVWYKGEPCPRYSLYPPCDFVGGRCPDCYVTPGYSWGEGVLAAWCEMTARPCVNCDKEGRAILAADEHGFCTFCHGTGSPDRARAAKVRAWVICEDHQESRVRFVVTDGNPMKQATVHSTEAAAKLALKRLVLRLFGEVKIVRQERFWLPRQAMSTCPPGLADMMAERGMKMSLPYQSTIESRDENGGMVLVSQEMTPEQLLPLEAK